MAAELGEVCTEQGWWGQGPRVGVGGRQWDPQEGDWMEDPKGGWSGRVTGLSQADTGSILWSQTHRSYGLLPPSPQQLEETRASLAPPAPSLSRTVSNKPANPASLFPPHQTQGWPPNHCLALISTPQHPCPSRASPSLILPWVKAKILGSGPASPWLSPSRKHHTIVWTVGKF